MSPETDSFPPTIDAERRKLSPWKEYFPPKIDRFPRKLTMAKTAKVYQGKNNHED